MSVRKVARARSFVTTAAMATVLAMGVTACELEEPTVEKGPAAAKEDSGAETPEEKKDGPLAAGDTAAYESGLKITVSQAAAYSPGRFAVGHTEGNTAYKLTVTLENTGDETVDTTLILPNARAGAAGRTAERIIDDSVGAGFTGSLLPGKKATADFAFDVPGDAKNLDVEIDPLDFSSEPAQWSIGL